MAMAMSYAPVNIEVTDALIKARDRVGLAVLMSIANRCSPTGITDIGVYRLSEVSGYARETVQQKLIEFQYKGWIKIRLVNDQELRRKRYRIQVSPDVIYIRRELTQEVLALWQRPSEIVMFSGDSVTKDRQPESGLTRWLKPESKPEENQKKTSVPTRNAQGKSGQNDPEGAQEITVQSYNEDYKTGEMIEPSEQITIESYNESYNKPASQIEQSAAQPPNPPPPVAARPPHPAPLVEQIVFQIKSVAPALAEKLIYDWINAYGVGVVQSAYESMCKTANVRNPAAYMRSLIVKKTGVKTAHNPLDGTKYLSREALENVTMKSTR